MKDLYLLVACYWLMKRLDMYHVCEINYLIRLYLLNMYKSLNFE